MKSSAIAHMPAQLNWLMFAMSWRYKKYATIHLIMKDIWWRNIIKNILHRFKAATFVIYSIPQCVLCYSIFCLISCRFIIEKILNWFENCRSFVVIICDAKHSHQAFCCTCAHISKEQGKLWIDEDGSMAV